MPEAALSPVECAALGTIARQAVVAAANGKGYLPPPELIAGRLAELGASFVTLHAAGELRGCIGSLTARRALGLDVAANARAATVEDRRFAPVEAGELDYLRIDLSLLTAPEPLPVGARAGLLTALLPGIDGLVLEEHGRRATFLPSVWEQLPDPEEFVSRLEKKAGLQPGSWSPARRAYRYRAASIQVGPVLA